MCERFLGTRIGEFKELMQKYKRGKNKLTEVDQANELFRHCLAVVGWQQHYNDSWFYIRPGVSKNQVRNLKKNHVYGCHKDTHEVLEADQLVKFLDKNNILTTAERIGAMNEVLPNESEFFDESTQGRRGRGRNPRG